MFDGEKLFKSLEKDDKFQRLVEVNMKKKLISLKKKLEMPYFRGQNLNCRISYETKRDT